MKKSNNLKHDFVQLKEEISTSYSATSLASEIFVILILFSLAIFLRPTWHLLSIAIASIGGVTLVWWIHNAGHDSFFKERRYAKAWIESLGIVFLGMPQIEYHFEVHRRHHAFTNIIGKDGALNTGPIRWHRKMYKSAEPSVLKFQAWVWFLFVLPLTWPLLTYRCVQTLFERRLFIRLFAFFFRWIAVLWLFDFDLAFIFIPILITGFVLGFVASLNHFHMLMDDQPSAEFPANVFMTTQNLSHRSYLMTWITGGLNFHIEHHLFPKIPSWKLRAISPLVQKFAKAHNLPYQVCTLPEATHKLYKRLENPLEDHSETFK